MRPSTQKAVIVIQNAVMVVGSAATCSSGFRDPPIGDSMESELDEFASWLEAELLESELSTSSTSRIKKSVASESQLGGDDGVEHQDITVSEFHSDLQQLIREDHMQNLQNANEIQYDFAVELDPLNGEMQLENIAKFEHDHSGEVEPQIGEVENAATHQPRWPVLPRSQSQGITKHKNNNQWEAHLWLKDAQLGDRVKDGMQIFLGSFNTEDEAKMAHDKAAIKLEVFESKGNPYPLNFSELTYADYMLEHSDWSSRDFLWKIRRGANKFSKGKCSVKGVVARNGKKGVTKYEATISLTPPSESKTTFQLGMCECEEEAGREYDKGLLFFRGLDSDCVTNFRPSQYSAAEVAEAGRRIKERYTHVLWLRNWP